MKGAFGCLRADSRGRGMLISKDAFAAFDAAREYGRALRPSSAEAAAKLGVLECAAALAGACMVMHVRGEMPRALEFLRAVPVVVQQLVPGVDVAFCSAADVDASPAGELCAHELAGATLSELLSLATVLEAAICQSVAQMQEDLSHAVELGLPEGVTPPPLPPLPPGVPADRSELLQRIVTFSERALALHSDCPRVRSAA